MLGTYDVVDLEAERSRIARSRYGVIEWRGEGLHRIRLRPWPKQASRFESWWSRNLGRHRFHVQDQIRIFYNEPRNCPGYLALPYIESDCGSSLRTLFGALDVLDQVAEIKNAEAIVCELANAKVSDRVMQRLGWRRHLHQSRRRHYIKRFERERGRSAGVESRVKRSGYSTSSG